jgi:chromosome segregation ATPase
MIIFVLFSSSYRKKVQHQSIFLLERTDQYLLFRKKLIVFNFLLDLINMLNFLKDQLLDDVVSRAEQSRFSYTLQTEEFRNLNSNLQTYLNDIKIIDDENCQLQENIEQIRTNYIITLENHLKRLPEDFRQESSILTEAHIERYKSKSRAKRFINEREELKKRINFAVSNEKDQIKRLNNLQKQERLVNNEFKNLNAQIQNLYNYVQIEKQTHQQAMNKVDNLQIQLEQICIERSKTEFEIQTLREEVKLMQTAKEFLDEERETILSTQTEANEYLLSRLNDSISRIREDFNDLNKTQLKQIENEYKQMIKILEENSLTNGTIDETMINHQRTIQISYEKLQDEHQSITQELTILNDHNQILSEKILNMETDLYSIRDERIRELITKDNEFERSQIELQTLDEKLNHLVEYDKNLKFELTLYRGVLESEYRRKQQQQQITNNQQPIRPTTLRSNRNSSVRI